MSQTKCNICKELFGDQDLVSAQVIGRYRLLASKSIYALSNIEKCVEIVYEDCNHPKGMPNGD